MCVPGAQTKMLVQSENSVQSFGIVFGTEIHFLLFGGCVRGVTQSPVTCINLAVLKIDCACVIQLCVV